MTIRKEFMEMAINLGELGRGLSHPNPSVGAVLVKEGEVIGKGYYGSFGGSHAETRAIDETSDCEGADLYVTLEPCNIYGKTPPCTKTIIEKRIKRVVCGIKDPNPLVSGKGFKELRENGVEVVEPFMEEECFNIDKEYHIFHNKGRPFVHLKWFETLDGATAIKGKKYIASESALKYVHQERFFCDAIMVTSSTLLRDDPHLNIRLYKEKKILRVIIDKKGIKELNKNLMVSAKKDGGVIVLRSKNLNHLPKIEGENVSTHYLDAENNYRELFIKSLAFLREKNIISLYVEAVGGLAQAIFEEGYIDRLTVGVSNKISGFCGSPPPIPSSLEQVVELKGCNIYKFGNDFIFVYEMEGKCFQV